MTRTNNVCGVGVAYDAQVAGIITSIVNELINGYG